jgi:hypothetical protein
MSMHLFFKHIVNKVPVHEHAFVLQVLCSTGTCTSNTSKLDSLGPPPFFAAAFRQIVPLASTIACDIPQFWHSVQPHHILYGHALEHSLSFYYRSRFGKHSIEAIMHIHI